MRNTNLLQVYFGQQGVVPPSNQRKAIEALTNETAAQALTRFRAAVSTTRVYEPGEYTTTTEPYILAEGATNVQPNWFNGAAYTRLASSHETSLHFFTTGPVEVIVAQLSGAAVPGRKTSEWPDTGFFAALTTSPFSGYNARVPLNPQVNGTAGVLQNVTYAVQVRLIGGNGTVFQFTFTPDGADHLSSVAAILPLRDPTESNGGGAGTDESTYIAEDFQPGAGDTPMSEVADYLSNPVEGTTAPTNP